MAAATTTGERIATLETKTQALEARVGSLESKFDRINGKLTALLTIFTVAALGACGQLVVALISAKPHP